MAKAKKKETLTPEERLQAVLVPDWEQPYKVPENWCWIHLLDSFETALIVKRKSRKKSIYKTEKLLLLTKAEFDRRLYK